MEITKEEYFTLKSAEIKLDMLESSGVDNWDWYGDALNPDDGKKYHEQIEDLKIQVFGQTAIA